MACGPCEQRRRMIIESYKKGGVVQVIKKVPHISVHMFRQPPKVKPK